MASLVLVNSRLKLSTPVVGWNLVGCTRTGRLIEMTLLIVTNVGRSPCSNSTARLNIHRAGRTNRKTDHIGPDYANRSLQANVEHDACHTRLLTLTGPSLFGYLPLLARWLVLLRALSPRQYSISSLHLYSNIDFLSCVGSNGWCVKSNFHV